jgi:uncharacterized protein (DUF58 family)
LKAELARLNHLLVPTTKAGRDRYRNTRLARRLRTLARIFGRLSREGRALCCMAVLALSLGADLGRGESHVLVLATLSLVGSALLFTRAYRLTGVSAELTCPRRVTIGEELTLTISLTNGGARAQHHIRTETPLLPWDGQFSELPPEIELLGPGAQKSTHARARFSARGAHQLDPFRVCALLPLGLSQGPPLLSGSACFMVVPKIARVLSLATLDQLRQKPGGVSRAARAGDATDLLGVRPYRPGDALRDLHARSWARHGSPMVREFQEEHQTRIGVVVDTDASARTPAHLEAALSLAAGIVARLCSGDARVHVLVTGQQVAELSLGRGTGALDQALDALASARAQPGFEADALLARLAAHLERLSSIVFVALSWDTARSSFVTALEARGVGTRVFVVGDSPQQTRRTTGVPLEAITSGQELSL